MRMNQEEAAAPRIRRYFKTQRRGARKTEISYSLGKSLETEADDFLPLVEIEDERETREPAIPNYSVVRYRWTRADTGSALGLKKSFQMEMCHAYSSVFV